MLECNILYVKKCKKLLKETQLRVDFWLKCIKIEKERLLVPYLGNKERIS